MRVGKVMFGTGRKPNTKGIGLEVRCCKHVQLLPVVLPVHGTWRRFLHCYKTQCTRVSGSVKACPVPRTSHATLLSEVPHEKGTSGLLDYSGICRRVGASSLMTRRALLWMSTRGQACPTSLPLGMLPTGACSLSFLCHCIHDQLCDPQVSAMLPVTHAIPHSNTCAKPGTGHRLALTPVAIMEGMAFAATPPLATSRRRPTTGKVLAPAAPVCCLPKVAWGGGMVLAWQGGLHIGSSLQFLI